MSQFKIGDIVRQKAAGYAAYITKKYLDGAGQDYYYDIYYWTLRKKSDRFRYSELEPLTMRNVKDAR